MKSNKKTTLVQQYRKQKTLENLKQAYQNNLLTIGVHSLQAYNDLKKKYNEATPQQWESLSPEAVQEFDHLRSLLIRAEQLERQHDLNKVRESKNIAIKLERHKYAPELNKAHVYLIVNKAHQKAGIIPAPQCTTIDEALNKLTGTQLKNLCSYV